MDQQKAIELFNLLKGEKIEGFAIVQLINFGKSAAVFKASSVDKKDVAIKIFDNDLVERFGHEIQTKRIEQEISLKNHNIENLIKIIGGGKTRKDEVSFHYLVMEFIEGTNLKDHIKNETYDLEFVSRVASTLIKLTEQLLSEYLIAHRDIKPENIMVSISGQIILMDLGVLKLIGANSFSDVDERQFLGTLRYAPPEFLIRSEEDSEDGWRAINIYQIGAVMYELIEKIDLFKNEKPYTNLVLAIKEKAPKIHGRPGFYNISQLTRNMLTKNWKQRLALNPISKIISICSAGNSLPTDLDQAIEAIKVATFDHSSELENTFALRNSHEEKLRIKNKTFDSISRLVDSCLDYLNSKGIFSNWKTSGGFTFKNYDSLNQISLARFIIWEIKGNLSQGFARTLYLVAEIKNDEYSFCDLGFAAIFANKYMPVDITKNEKFFFDLKSEVGADHSSLDLPFSFCRCFEGVIDCDDLEIKNKLIISVATLIRKALQEIYAEVQYEIKLQKDMAEQGVKAFAILKSKSPTYIINTLN
ncbi:MAG: protein kinase [Bacteroidia bacterium]